MDVKQIFRAAENVFKSGKYCCRRCFWIKFFKVKQIFSCCPKCGHQFWEMIED